MKRLAGLLTIFVLSPGLDAGAQEMAGEERPETGLVAVKSEFPFAETGARLEQAVLANSALGIAARIDHSANATAVGMKLRPTLLLIVANPVAGTPLLQGSQTLGIDLPQKLLVYEDEDGQTFVAYNDPFFLARRHGIEGRDEMLQRIAGALAGLAAAATQ
jgi:uncharacterized protein (DUF302 family)